LRNFVPLLLPRYPIPQTRNKNEEFKNHQQEKYQETFSKITNKFK